jgi:hypothetical protein
MTGNLATKADHDKFARRARNAVNIVQRFFVETGLWAGMAFCQLWKGSPVAPR